MSSEYLDIAEGIEIEWRQIERAIARSRDARQKAKRSSDDLYIDAAGANLHSVYNGLEHIFEAIAKGVDQSTPSGGSWHEQLLQQMAHEFEGRRPPVISEQSYREVHEYMRFRHLVRNIYSHNLVAKRIDELVDGLTYIEGDLATEIFAFADLLKQLAVG